MNERVALIEDLMRKHLPSFWKYELKDYLGHKTLGLCKFSKKTLYFNRHYIKNATLEDVKETVLHEIAHALTSSRHDQRFKRVAQKLGCTGARIYKPKALQFIYNLPTRYLIRCPKCKMQVGRNARRRYFCKKCLTDCEIIKTN